MISVVMAECGADDEPEEADEAAVMPALGAISRRVYEDFRRVKQVRRATPFSHNRRREVFRSIPSRPAHLFPKNIEKRVP